MKDEKVKRMQLALAEREVAEVRGPAINPVRTTPCLEFVHTETLSCDSVVRCCELSGHQFGFTIV